MADLSSFWLGLSIVFIAFVTASASEAFNYYFITRKVEYQRLEASLVKTARLVEKQRAEGKDKDKEKQKKNDRRVSKLEVHLKKGFRDLSSMKTKANLTLAVITIVIFFSISKWYAGKVVGRLPFHPWGIVRNFTHKGLTGDDPREVGMAFLYFTVNLAIKGSISKLVGSEVPRPLQGISVMDLGPFKEDKES